MNNLFLPYELALAVKEEGFKDGCIAYYFSNTKEFKVISQLPLSNEFNLTVRVEEVVPAPLYEQVLEWFFWKGIGIEIYICDKGSKYGYQIIKHGNDSFEPKPSDSKSSGNKSEVLNQAIEEALKYIKSNVKNQDKMETDNTHPLAPDCHKDIQVQTKCDEFRVNVNDGKKVFNTDEPPESKTKVID